MSVKLNNRTGIVVGARKDASRCVLWSDDTFEWFDAATFAATFN